MKPQKPYTTSAVIAALKGIQGDLMKPLLHEQRVYILRVQRQLGAPGRPISDQHLSELLGLKNKDRVRKWKRLNNPSTLGDMNYRAMEKMLKEKVK